MKPSEKLIRRSWLAFIIAAGSLFYALTVLFFIPAFNHSIYMRSFNEISDPVSTPFSDLKQLTQRAEVLERNVKRFTTSGGSFLIINTADNTFRLYRNNEMVGSGLCSTGSLIHLEVDSTRSWLFETPRGVWQVRNKIVDPVWRKPDWAFIEEGLQPPPAGHSSRYEKGVLGDYALDLGNGYLIHGTLYQRLLGRSVTHGCIRLNDNDLELVYNTLNRGSKVYIY